MGLVREGNEFWASFRGIALRDLPDLPLVVRPLIDTSLHRLAIETNPEWTFRVRHVGSWRIKTRPKISVFCDSKHFQFGISFQVPARGLYNDIEQVWKDLENASFAIRSRTLQVTCTPKLDELAIMTKFNDERQAHLLRSGVIVPPVTPSNVIDLSELLGAPANEYFKRRA